MTVQKKAPMRTFETVMAERKVGKGAKYIREIVLQLVDINLN